MPLNGTFPVGLEIIYLISVNIVDRPNESKNTYTTDLVPEFLISM